MALPLDIVQLLYSYVNWYDFKSMRLVCQMWREASYRNQFHWLKWLNECGSVDHWERIGHRKERRTCDFRTGQCTDPGHYDTVIRHPKILITVPIHKQVLNQAVRAKREKLRRQFAKTLELKNIYEQYVISLRKGLTEAQSELTIADVLLLKHNQQRKRTRIEFSKQ